MTHPPLNVIKIPYDKKVWNYWKKTPNLTTLTRSTYINNKKCTFNKHNIYFTLSTISPQIRLVKWSRVCCILSIFWDILSICISRPSILFIRVSTSCLAMPWPLDSPDVGGGGVSDSSWFWGWGLGGFWMLACGLAILGWGVGEPHIGSLLFVVLPGGPPEALSYGANMRITCLPYAENTFLFCIHVIGSVGVFKGVDLPLCIWPWSTSWSTNIQAKMVQQVSLPVDDVLPAVLNLVGCVMDVKDPDKMLLDQAPPRLALCCIVALAHMPPVLIVRGR